MTSESHEAQWRRHLSQRADYTSLLSRNTVVTAADLFEFSVDRFPGFPPIVWVIFGEPQLTPPKIYIFSAADQIAVMEVESSIKYTYAQLDSMANQVANWAKGHQLACGDVVRVATPTPPFVPPPVRHLCATCAPPVRHLCVKVDHPPLLCFSYCRWL